MSGLQVGSVLASLILVGITLGLVLTPSSERIRAMALGSDRVLLSSDGRLVQTLRTDFSKRRLGWYPLKNFPEHLRQSVLLAEDRRFYQHFGFDPVGIARAAKTLFGAKRRQGASTITMQLTDLIQEDVLVQNRPIKKGSLLHKGWQLVRAMFLEAKWSKDEILEAYLNLIHLRGEYQGVPAASLAYLNKHPLALDSAESAVLAKMIASPNQKAVRLLSLACPLYKEAGGGEDCGQVDRAVSAFYQNRPSLPVEADLAPHLTRLLAKQNPNSAIFESTIDANLQAEVQGILEKNLRRLKNQNVNDSAAIVIDNKTGAVLAYVGAIASSSSPHVDGVRAYRQAGSTLKSFIYGKALESKTLSLASILIDDPTAISWNGTIYRPTNYDKHFYGTVSVREALASSLNVPAVKAVTILGLHQTYAVLQNLQLTNLKEPDFYGVSMALGAVEVRLDELANAYRALANGGEWSPLKFTTEKSKEESKRVFSPESSYLISSVLSDPIARAIGFGSENPLETSFWTAVKTGTSKDYRDNWCIGFSERFTVGVWAGNFNAEAMHKVSGVTGAGPSWYEIMNYLHRSVPSRAPAKPAGVIAKKVRHAWNSSAHEEFFIAGTEPAGEVIEPALEKRVQFVFPADGSILIKDPHIDQERVALFVRFKGAIPNNAGIFWDGKRLGEAVSPFRMDKPPLGRHTLAIRSSDGKELSSVQFTIKGAE